MNGDRLRVSHIYESAPPQQAHGQPRSGTGRDDPIQFSGAVSCIDLRDPRSSPAPGVSPASTADIAGLGRGRTPH